jgi:uncharacterized protein (TIGR03083 family)
VPTIVDHDSTVTLLAEEFAAIEELCGALPATDWDRPTCLPGWTVRDNLSHMIGTESLLLGLAAPAVEIPQADYLKNPIAEANEAWVESMRANSGEELVARFQDVTGQRLAALRAMTQADFDAPSWTPAGPDETYGRFMRIRHFDCFMHEHDIRSAVGAADRATPSHVRFALDEVSTGLGFIVGKRARLPQGTSVRIELTGPVEQTYLVSVEERARVVEALDQPPTVTLSMPAMVFLRLTGGRERAASHRGKDLSEAGDEELAHQLADHLAFTI